MGLYYYNFLTGTLEKKKIAFFFHENRTITEYFVTKNVKLQKLSKTIKVTYELNSST